MNRLPQPAMEDFRLADVLRALADPVRLEVLVRISGGGEHPCVQTGASLGVHKSTMSHHYRVLREAGITSTRQEGRIKYLSLRRDELDSRFPGLLDAVLASAPPRLDAALTSAPPRTASDASSQETPRTAAPASP
ncbi:ArsR/SmtB family transcription factor [Streptosporangium sp. CA-135522]|uniref:ArsR/SmtB family transcription factor n=1 Tax=Streptosporangium sp. CA-135522 TaxID=3240072 RepID=UPI003D8FA4AC